MSSADRKSTRLNSSHSQISYAVFCLKKKTMTTMPVALPFSLHSPRAPRPLHPSLHDALPISLHADAGADRIDIALARINGNLRPIASLAHGAADHHGAIVNFGHFLLEQLDEQRRSEEHTSELQSQSNLVCRLLLEKKNDDHHARSTALLVALPTRSPPSTPFPPRRSSDLPSCRRRRRPDRHRARANKRQPSPDRQPRARRRGSSRCHRKFRALPARTA